VCPVLPVSLDCPILIAPSVFSNVYLIAKSGKYYVMSFTIAASQCMIFIFCYLLLFRYIKEYRSQLKCANEDVVAQASFKLYRH